MRFDVLTIFPNFFGAPAGKSVEGAGIFGSGMLRRALHSGAVEAHAHDLRAFAADKHRTVDDRPFGGGEGMVLKPEPFARGLAALEFAPKGSRTREEVVLLAAGGRRFTQAAARELAGLDRVALLCGRYEGVDERVAEQLADRELSIGDYILTGGELAAAVIVDAVARLVPGVLGNAASHAYESFGAVDSALTHVGLSPQATHGAGGLLDYPQYTRPADWEGARVPDVLLAGDHAQVRRWRREQALARTWRNRPDLLAGAELSAEDRMFLAELEQTEAVK